MPSSMLKKRKTNLPLFLGIHGVVTALLGIVALCVLGRHQALSFALGQFLVWLSLLSISLSVYLLFLKKNIALIVGVIVFKWPILIYVVYRLVESMTLVPVFLALGFLPVLASSLIWSMLQKD